MLSNPVTSKGEQFIFRGMEEGLGFFICFSKNEVLNLFKASFFVRNK
ncbi:MAG: hypothetical protein Athens101410_579 [Parcubacteria group bacterium Athens1014_10]|nr:MAG: hypothetical protein Athens101410_579 [Parcubacteria group bacterium Athens1014_10]TSD04640.1 MAG: hypothetical protein Athens071412_707 [Parcubacteria group bacterium Athens0714_12]